MLFADAAACHSHESVVPASYQSPDYQSPVLSFVQKKTVVMGQDAKNMVSINISMLRCQFNFT